MSIAFNISIAQIPMSIEGSGENKLTDVDLGGSFPRYLGPLHGEHVSGKHFQYLWRIRNLQCVIIGDATTYRTKRDLGLPILGKSGLSGVAVEVLEAPVL